MSTNCFLELVKTNVEVGSLRSSGIWRDVSVRPGQKVMPRTHLMPLRSEIPGSLVCGSDMAGYEGADER